ncbi:hypothetical protein ACRAWF_06800 [Streptomyces sp. L7]
MSYRLGGAETLLCLSTAAGLLAPFLAGEQRMDPGRGRPVPAARPVAGHGQQLLQHERRRG